MHTKNIFSGFNTPLNYRLWFLNIFTQKTFMPVYWILWKICFSDTEFCEESVFLKFNFVKSPFFTNSILCKVHFSHIEFYEESVFLILNSVKFFNIEFCEMFENGLNFSLRQTPWIGFHVYGNLRKILVTLEMLAYMVIYKFRQTI